MGALLRKEWRELRWMLLGVLLIGALAVAGLLVRSDRGGSPLLAYFDMITKFAPLLAPLLANRLVVREYSGRTQLFLETLPVSRAQVLGVKWAFGAALLLAAMALCFGVALLAARGHVTITGRFIGLMAIRSASYLLLLYTLAFAIGLSGRYRYLLWAALAASLAYAAGRAQLPVTQWAPFALVRETMVYEHLLLPARDVAITCALAAALVAASFALALGAEGALVVALARRMSPGEKVGVTVAVLGLMVGLSMIEARKEKPPFVLDMGVHSRRPPDVGVAGYLENSQEMADQLSDDLRGIQGYLALPVTPSLTVMPDEALDADVYQTASLPKADGVVLRAAFDNSQFDRDALRAYAVSQWLQWYSLYRSSDEERRWLVDGFAARWTARGRPEREARLALRAAFAQRLLRQNGLGAADALARWKTVRERLGYCLAEALAWRMVGSLESQVGARRFQSFVTGTLAATPSAEAWSPLLEPSLGQQLVRAGAPEPALLARRFDSALADDAARVAARLDALALARVSLRAVALPGGSQEIHYALAAGTVAPPFAVRYFELNPWDSELAEEQPERVDARGPGVLPATFAAGTRLYTAVEQYVPALACTVRLSARRWALP